MKLKLHEIIAAKPILENFPAKISFIISRNIRAINQELEGFEKERNRLFEKYQIKPNTQTPNLGSSKENTDNFLKEFNAFIQTEIDIPITTISVNEFSYNISPENISLIYWMFSFEE